MKEEHEGSAIVGVPTELSLKFDAHKNAYFCGRIDTKIHKKKKDRHDFVVKIINRKYGIYEIDYNFLNF